LLGKKLRWPKGAEGKRFHAWQWFHSKLGKDWTKAKTSSAGERPRIDAAFVEVTREEWIRRESQTKKA
jgi:hypothetical protein